MIRHLSLGRSDYGETLALQRTLHARRSTGELDDLLISVEHNPVFTIGRSGSSDNILVSADVLQEQGIALFQVERGGDITYHGPGQLVVYPILDLRSFGKDIHRFIWWLEEAIIRTTSEFGIASDRRNGFPGVWVGLRKIASVGVYVKNWVTYHGLAFNIEVSRQHFRMIRPCGLSVETVSLNDLSTPSVTLPDVCQLLIQQLGLLLDRDIIEIEHTELN